MTEVGHNSKKPRAGGVAVDQLKSIIGRIEKLTEEKEGIAADIRDIFAEAKGNGFDTKAIRSIIKLRKKDAAERDEEELVLDTYLVALGMKEQPDLFDSEERAEPEQAKSDRADLYAQAVDIVLRDQKASTSYIQRCLGIGYNSAAQLIEKMESEGIVGPANHIGKREVLRQPASGAA